MARFTNLVQLFGPTGVSSTTPGTNSPLGSANSVYDTSMRHNISLQLVAGSENAVFSLEISNDGVNFIPYNRLVANVTNTNAQTDSGITYASVTANTSAFYFVKLGDTFRFVRGSASLVSTDGTFNAFMHTID